VFIFFKCASTSTGLCITFFDAGYFSINKVGRIGRSTKLPPQFGQTFCKTVVAQSLQKVHSNVQIIASLE
jgi:hypothetical protein